MNPFLFQKHNLDEVVFENRNKQYGAYVLRKSYDSNLLKASASSLGLFIVMGGFAYLLSLGRTEIPKVVSPIHITPVETMMRKIEIILDPPEQAAAASASTHTTFRIVRDANVVRPAETTPQDPVAPTTGVQGGTPGGEGIENTSGTGTQTGGSTATIAPPAPPFVTIAEEMPSFVGGQEAMIRYLSNQIQYPPQARENGIEGKVVVSFVVQTDGSISMIQLVKGIGFGCDEEAIRVIESMPKWNVGKQNGKLLAVKLVLPIVFRLQ